MNHSIVQLISQGESKTVKFKSTIGNKFPTTNFTFNESGDGFLVALEYSQQNIPWSLQSNQGISEGLNEGENKLFDTIKKNPGIRIPEMAEILLSPKKTVERWISKLNKLNFIEYRGSKKNRWIFCH